MTTPVFKSPVDVLAFVISQLECMSTDYKMASAVIDVIGMLEGDEGMVKIMNDPKLKDKEGIKNMMSNPSSQVVQIDKARVILGRLTADLRAQEAIEMVKGIGRA